MTREQIHMEKIGNNSKIIDFHLTTSVVTLSINYLKPQINVRDYQIV